MVIEKYHYGSFLRSFNNECTEAIKKVRYTNYERIAKRIKKSFEQHNKIYSVNEIQITNEYLNLKLKELDLAFKYQCKKEDEKEALQEERQREKENKALEREANKKKQQIKKDIDHYSKAIKELNLRLEKEKENQGLKDEIAKLKEQISSKEDTDSSIDSQLYNPQAGYVYIISNIGSFGKDVVKIGVTRRLKPEERIKELSSASVPFKFDTHALIFSSNAFDLETKLHHRFDEQRINMVNNRKEFFRVPIEEIEKELQKYDNVTVDFNEVPEADEYRQTLKIRNEENDSKDISELLKTN